MSDVRSAVFPGLLLGCLTIILFSGTALKPQVVEAFASKNSPSTNEVSSQKQAGSQQGENCSLPGQVPGSIRQWCDLIDQASQKYNLDASLLAALIAQESGGNPRAYSSSGAVGLMQVMPRDGVAASFSCAAGPCFASRPSMAELYDPSFNITFGTNYLAGLLGRFGDVREALRAYGPSDIGYRYADIVLAIYQKYKQSSG